MTEPEISANRLPELSIVIPALNERGEIEATLAAAREAAERWGRPVEVIAVDGGSRDGTWELLERAAETWEALRVERSGAGRARQMNHGAAMARADWLLFLHADTHLSPGALEALAARIEEERRSPGASDKHLPAPLAFRLRFRDPRKFYRRMEVGVEWRTRRLAMPYGDQGFCLHRSLFDRLGGFREDVALEDLDLALRAHALGARFALVEENVSTSVRQWERQGIVIGMLYNLGRMAAELALFFLRGEYVEWRRAGLRVGP